MVKIKFKRVLSFVLAAVISLTTLVGVESTTAFANVGEQANVYIVEFPRSGDANSNRQWGHEKLNYMNGWSAISSNTQALRVMGSYSGNIVYCIEPGTGQYTGDTLTEKGENYFNNISENGTISGDDIRLLIGRILQYGYRGGVSTSWKSQNKDDANCLAQAFATQILISETVVGERDAGFNHKTTGEYDAILDCISSAHPLRSKILSYYNSIVTSVQNHTKVPSFCTRSSGSAKVNELEWNGNKYVATLTDSNGVLKNYNFSANISGVSFSVSGNKLTISMDTAPSKEFTITASKKNGIRQGVVVWTDGKHSHGNGIQDVVSYTQEVSDPVSGFVKMKVSYGSCQIVKTSEDGKVDGINFTISGNGKNQTVSTANGGKVQLDNLMPGVYTVTEQSIDKYVPQEVHRVTVVAGQVAKVNFNNVLKRGDIQVIKSSEDNFVEGVTFHLYGASLAGIAVDEFAVTNADGIATFNDVLISGDTPYTVEEVNTDVRYVIPAKQDVFVKWNEVTSCEFTNILKKFSVTVTKSDREEGTSQGNASLGGAVYGIYKGETLVDKYFTDQNGQFTTKEYICDNDWTIREITPSKGYLIDTIAHKVGADPKLYTSEHNLTSINVTEQVIKGNISIIKHTDNGETQIETPENGAKFEIYLKSAGSYSAAKEDERDVILCDEHGFGQTKMLPYGVYTVLQVSGWDGRELMDDFDVFISQDGQTYRYLINNANFESYIQVVKSDAETGKTIPYAGAGFKIYDPSGNQVTMSFTYPTLTTIGIFYTDATGQLVTPEKLPFGKGYYLVEAQAPYGYVLDSTPVSFDVIEENSCDEGGVTVIKVNKFNMAQKGTVTIEKNGEVFFGVNVSGDEDTVIHQPVYEDAAIAGAVFEIRAAEDIITPDGTLRYAKGEVVDTITTGADGMATSKEIYLGKYEVQEIEAPYGYVISTDIHSVELIYAGQNVSVTETATSFYNERQKATLSMQKVLETNDLFEIGNNGEIKNVVFGLYAAEELVSASGTSIPADGLIEVITFDKNGLATIKTDLPLGSYYVKEIATDEHYILNDTKYHFSFNYTGQDSENVEIRLNDGKPIENDLIYGSVEGMKTTEHGDALEGAVIGLFKKGETNFTTDNALMTTTSAEDGSFSFVDIPYGEWIVREIEQPIGFVLNKTVFDVVIKENAQIVEIEIVNEFIKGDITLTKVDADYPENKLSGATFEVYKDNNADGVIDEGDELIGTLTEKDGVYGMLDLYYGHYLVKETVAPIGFLLDEGVYSVFIDTDEKVYAIENEAGVGFINEAMTGSLKIVKTSSDGKVEGFSFHITGVNGFDVTLKTDENGEIFLDGLRIGEYTVSEVVDEVSSQYFRPDDKKANVMTDSTTIVEMHNVFIDNPKTGDDSNIGLWLGLLGASVLGIGATVFFGFKRRKKEDKQ